MPRVYVPAEFSMHDYNIWQHSLLGALPKEKESVDEPGSYLDLNKEDMLHYSAKFHLNRDMGPNYCFLCDELKTAKREEFVDKNFKIRNISPERLGSAELMKRLEEIRMKAYSATTPLELYDYYKDFWRIVWSNNNGLNEYQVKNAYDNSRKRQEGIAHNSWDDGKGLEEINSEIRKNKLAWCEPGENLKLF
jgi:hypothetical protein